MCKVERGEVCSRRNDKILPHTPIRKACRPAPAIPSGCTCGAALHRRAELCADYGAGMVRGCGPALPVVVHFLSLAPLLHGVRSVRWPVSGVWPTNRKTRHVQGLAARAAILNDRGADRRRQRTTCRLGAVRLNDQSRPTRGGTGSRREEYIKEQRRHMCRLCCWVSLRCPAGRITRGGVPSWWSHRRG